MKIWQAIFLGIVQGFTEFLPISSSGHLAILQNWMQISPSVFYFDLFLHLMSLLVIVYYFRKTILSLDKQTIINLIIATIPLLIVGVSVRSYIQPMFSSNLIVSLGLITTAGLNFFAAHSFLKSENTQDNTKRKSFLIGLSQIMALIPGISRSGSTLFGASAVKLDKSKAFEFIFLMAIPAILAASFGEIITLDAEKITHLTETSIINFVAGGAACLIISFISLKLLKLTLDKAKYHLFGWYCLILGLTTLLFSIF